MRLRLSNTSLTGLRTRQEEIAGSSRLKSEGEENGCVHLYMYSPYIDKSLLEDEMEVLGRLKKRPLPLTGDFEEDDFVTERTPKKCSNEKEKVGKSIKKVKGNMRSQKKGKIKEI